MPLIPISLYRSEGSGSSATQVALLSVTTAPSGAFAVGSKYYDSTEKKIYTAVTADTWTGATSADPAFNTIYTYDSGYYKWDGDNLVSTDVDAFIKGATVNGVSVVDGNKIAVIPNASNTVIGASRFATDAEVATGTAENLAVNPKQLKDRGAEFEQSDFELQENVLSSAVKKVVSNSSFFIFENGDVSKDGKTLFKSNTLVNPSPVGWEYLTLQDTICNENYYIQTYTWRSPYESSSMVIYSIGADGALTHIRSITYIRENRRFVNKLNFVNGFLCSPGHNADFLRGFFYIAENDIEDTEVSPTFVILAGGDAPVLKVGYSFGKYCALGFTTAPYLYYADTIDAVFTENPGIGCGSFGQNGNDAIFETDKIIVASADTRTVVFTSLTAPAVYTSAFSSATGVKKIGNTYYFFNSSNGTFATTDDITQTPVIVVDAEEAPIISYDIASVSTNKVMTLNSDDILLSEEVKIPILKSEVIDSSTAAIVIAKVKNNTVYKYGIIDSLVITAVEVSNRKSIIYFSTSADFTTFTPPTAQAFIGSGAVVAEKSYKIEIENGIMEVKEYGVPA